jgi:DNA-binding NarL/FixJ family response regulator
MRSKNDTVLVRPEPDTELSAAPRRRPTLAFAWEDSLGSDKPAAPPIRILVVEDNFLVASQVEMALCDAGFDVSGVAASAEEAVELARAQKPALVVMDVRLAGQRDGIYAAVEIFRNLGIRCIFATAHYDQHSLDRAKPAMPLGWLQKPYSMISLVDTVHQALEELDRSS